MKLTVGIESPRRDDLLALIRAGDEYGLSLYPAESYYGVDLEGLERPEVAFFAARRDGVALGIGALVDRGDGSAELKRMFVSPEARGLGIASALLRAIEQAAADRDIRLVQLETGPKQPDAIALYEKHGYRLIENFGPYVGDPWSVCMEKAL